MIDQKDLKARITTLEDLENIKKLKAKYWRCVDKNLWDELGECFSEDAVAAFGTTGYYEGRKAILDFSGRVIREESLL